MKAFTNSALLVAGLYSLLASGCNLFDGPAETVTRSVDDVRKDLKTQSRLWRTESDDWQDIATDMQEFIAEEFGGDGKAMREANAYLIQAIDHSKAVAEQVSAAFGEDSRLTIKYANALMVRNLDAAITVLKQYEVDPTLEANDFEALLEDTIQSIPLEPEFGRSNPSDLVATWNDPSSHDRGFLLSSDQLNVTGFGFDHPDLADRLLVTLSDDTDVSHWVEVTSQYALRLNVDSADRPSLPDTTSIRLVWKTDESRDLGTIPIRFYRTPSIPDPIKVDYTWKHDGTFQKAAPEKWNFGMKPTVAFITNKEGITRDIALSEAISMSNLAAR